MAAEDTNVSLHAYAAENRGELDMTSDTKSLLIPTASARQRHDASTNIYQTQPTKQHRLFHSRSQSKTKKLVNLPLLCSHHSKGGNSKFTPGGEKHRYLDTTRCIFGVLRHGPPLPSYCDSRGIVRAGTPSSYISPNGQWCPYFPCQHERARMFTSRQNYNIPKI